MINVEDLKPILKDFVSEENMADAVVRISEIDKDVDTSDIDEANATIAKLQEQNKKLTEMFFTGNPMMSKNSSSSQLSTGTDDEADEDEKPLTYDDLFVPIEE